MLIFLKIILLIIIRAVNKTLGKVKSRTLTSFSSNREVENIGTMKDVGN